MTEPVYILSAELVGSAEVVNGHINIGGLEVPYRGPEPASVYVRRLSSDLSVAEIHIARHDGLAQEQLDRQNEEAEHHPLGPKEYWRAEMVGKYRFGADGHVMTDEDFETEWQEDE